MNVLRQIVSYVVPILVLIGQGQWNPLPADNPFHGVFGPLVIALATWLSLRIHPNGVNGQPLNHVRKGTIEKEKGEAKISLLVILAFVCLGLFSGSCALLKAIGITVDASGICVNIPFQQLSATVECGSVCLPDGSEQFQCRHPETKEVSQVAKLEWKKP